METAWSLQVAEVQWVVLEFALLFSKCKQNIVVSYQYKHCMENQSICLCSEWLL